MKLKGVDVAWAEEFNGAITVCDVNGIIVYMNQYSIQQFEKYGGVTLLGSSLIDCHPEPSRTKLKEMLEEQSENIYTTEKDGVKTMIVQTPWKENGIFCGLVEISFQFDSDLPNYLR